MPHSLPLPSLIWPNQEVNFDSRKAFNLFNLCLCALTLQIKTESNVSVLFRVTAITKHIVCDVLTVFVIEVIYLKKLLFLRGLAQKKIALWPSWFIGF